MITDDYTTSAPTTLPVQLDHIPATFKTEDRWVGWAWTFNPNKAGHHNGWDKPPLNARTGKRASSTDPETWSSYGQAVDSMQRNSLDGVGFNLFALQNIVVHDLDGCRDPEAGEITPQAMNIVRLVGAYWEVSPSGTGIRGICLGKKTGTRVEATKGGPIDGAQYDGSAGRYITLTGHTLPESTPDIVGAHPGGIEAAYALMFPARERRPVPNATPKPVDVDDLLLIDKAKNARNGDKFSRLWDGDISGYQSESEAELALCNHLVFWTGGDVVRVDLLFRQSALMRPKWDEPRGEGTWGAQTISAALAKATEFYTPGGGGPPVIHKNGNRQHPDRPLHTFCNTDQGNAERFVALHGADLRYCWKWERWLVYDGKRWNRDMQAGVHRRASQTVRAMYDEAGSLEKEVARLEDGQERDKLAKIAEALAKWARNSESAARLQAIVTISRRWLDIDPDLFDADPDLLNFPNGTLHLPSGELRPHRREDYSTMLTAAPFERKVNF